MKKASKINERKQQAQFLYMTGGKSQKEIADLVGVCERTVHSWIHQYAWDKLRLAGFLAPATIADNLGAQIVELQNSIAAREPNNRFPNMQEAEITRKLVTCYEKMKKYPSLSQSMQVLETFRNYIRPIDKDFARELGRYTTDFLEAKSVNGYAPYQLEYGVEPISPIMSDYDEVEGLDSNKTEYVPCPDHLTCLYPGKCNYPYCMKEKERDISVDDYKVTPVLFTRSQPQKTEVPAATGSYPAISLQQDLGLKGSPPLGAEGYNNPAISTSENRKNELSTNPQITNNEMPPIPKSQFPIPSPEPTGFNRDRFMELLKKLHKIANSDDETTSLSQDLGLKGSPPLGAEGFDNPAISTSDPATFIDPATRKNDQAA